MCILQDKMKQIRIHARTADVRNAECFCYLPVSAMNGICSLPMPGWKRNLLSKRTLYQQDRKLGLKPFADVCDRRYDDFAQLNKEVDGLPCVAYCFWQRKRVYGSKGQIIVVATTTFAHQFPIPGVAFPWCLEGTSQWMFVNDRILQIVRGLEVAHNLSS